MSTYLTLSLMLFAFGVISGAIAVALMAASLLRPARMSDGKAVWVYRRLSPGDLGLAFEDVRFQVRDPQSDKDFRMTGWWIPHAAAGGRCILLLHGFADAKVGAIAWAPLWHSLGFNVVAIDLRAHGESGGIHFTGGFWERHDVNQIIDQLRAQRPTETGQIILFGVGLGAAVAAAAATMRDDLAAVVLENPFPDYRAAAAAHLNHIGAAGRWLQSLALRWAQHLGRFDCAAVRTAELITQITCPVMIIIPQVAPSPADDDADEMERALHSRGRDNQDVCWRVITGRLLALTAAPDEYHTRTRDFLKKANVIR